MTTLKLPLAVLALVVSAGGCSRGGERDAPMVPASGKSGVDERSIGAISHARCDRELACQNIGPGRHWPTRASCVKDLSQLGREELGADQCPTGIDRLRFDDCMREIADETCDRPLTSFERYIACHPGALCVQ